MFKNILIVSSLLYLSGCVVLSPGLDQGLSSSLNDDLKSSAEPQEPKNSETSSTGNKYVNETKALELNDKAVSKSNYFREYIEAISLFQEALSLEFDNVDLKNRIKTNLAHTYASLGDKYAKGDIDQYPLSLDIVI